MDPAVRGAKRGIYVEGGTLLWICAVYLVSFGCYLPLLLEQSGKNVPGGLLLLRYGFVLVPAAISLIAWVREGGIKTCLLRQCKPVSRKEAGLCAVMALTGVAAACGYSLAEKTNLFGSAYPSMLSLAGGCVYLFATALAEETAWRGFLYQRMAAGGNRPAAAAASGMLWAVWHIPMWWIRNALPVEEIAALLLWAALLGSVLAMFYSAFSNIVSAALLHMTCNICWIAPAKCNVPVLLLGILVCCAVQKGHGGKADDQKERTGDGKQI